jgi:hypothetical protein
MESARVFDSDCSHSSGQGRNATPADTATSEVDES